MLREVAPSKEKEEEFAGQVYGLFGKYHYAACQKLFAFLKVGQWLACYYVEQHCGL